MALGTDPELLADFLTEAGEILELLNGQLLDLENSPDDAALLNAVFRGFHTIKGGAGFLQLHPVVEVCHRAEDVFNLLRNGTRRVDSTLMDVILPVLDVVNAQFANMRAGAEPPSATPELLQALQRLTVPPVAEAPVAAPVRPAPDPGGGDAVDEEFEQLLAAAQQPAAAPLDNAAGGDDDISDEEFDTLLDKLHGKGGAPGQAPPAVAAAAGEDISDEEFDTLLDQLHGKGGAPGQAKPVAATAGGDDISDEEFDKLLDQLHGKGGAPGQQKAVPPPAPTAAVADDRKDGDRAPRATAKPVAPVAASKDSAVQVDNSIRVDTRRLDEIMNLVGELVLVRNRIATLQRDRNDEASAKVVANLDLVTSDLHAAILKTRMQPVKKVFSRFPRVVRDLSRTLRKEVNLEMQGEETDLDKNLVDALADPMIHLVRNAVDHGIEMPEQRLQAGKPRAGTVLLSARQEGDHILLDIKDDGAGMDAEVLRRKVVEKGLMDTAAAQRLDRKECFNLIFLPGFSTKEQISDVSGRGVGMDVVKSSISQLNGTVEIESEPGKGTTLTLKVPLTLAIMPTLMVRLQSQIFALPLVNVNEILNFNEVRANSVDGQRVITLRKKVLPLFHLGQWLEMMDCDGCVDGHGYVVVVNVGSQQIGLMVDHLIGQEEVVIKPLGAMLHTTRGLAGATITGNGRVALILDLPELLAVHAVAC